MCGPWALPLAFAISGVGGGLQFAGDRQAQNAQMGQYEAERARQQQFTNQQQGLFEDSLSRAAAMADPAHMAAATAAREAPLVAAVRPAGPTDYLPGASSASPIVHAAADRAEASQRAGSVGLAQALAHFGGFGDQLLDTSIMNSRNAGRIGQIGSFMQGSNAASQTEIAAAANRGATLRGLGSLASQIGMALASGGAGGAAGGAKVVGAGTGGQWGQLASFFGKGAMPGTSSLGWAG